MALGTVTMVNSAAGGRPSAPLYALKFTVVGESSYAAGGTAGFAATIQAAAKVAGVKLVVSKENIVGLLALDSKGYDLGYDDANDKLIVRYYDYNASGDGAAIEVPDATDLSSVTFRLSVLLQ